MPRVPDSTKTRARELRHEMTEAETRLWKHLRAHRLGGWPFRRQHPIPPYIVDFASPDARVIIEVDGVQHAASGRDGERDAFLASEGWKVLRFWNNDVLANSDGVVTTILRALGPRPTR